MITIYQRKPRDEKPTIVETVSPHSWVVVTEPTPEDLTKLENEFLLDRSLLTDALDPYEVPRIEIADGIVYIFTRFAAFEENTIETHLLLLAITKTGVITISQTPFPRTTDILHMPDGNLMQPVNLVLYILAEINDTYNSTINSISKRVQSLSVNVERIRNRDIVAFLDYEGILSNFSTALVRMETMYANIAHGKILTLNETQQDIAEDISLETVQLTVLTQESLREIRTIREAYSTILTNNLNQVIKLFTSLTVILTIPTMIGTFYGMNLRLPFADHPMAFGGIVGLTLLVSFFLLVFFNKRDWL